LLLLPFLLLLKLIHNLLLRYLCLLSQRVDLLKIVVIASYAASYILLLIPLSWARLLDKRGVFCCFERLAEHVDLICGIDEAFGTGTGLGSREYVALLEVRRSLSGEGRLPLHNYILIPHFWLRKRLPCCFSWITRSTSCFDSAALSPCTYKWRDGLMRFRFIPDESCALLEARIQCLRKIGHLWRLQSLRLYSLILLLGH